MAKEKNEKKANSDKGEIKETNLKNVFYNANWRKEF